MTALDPHAPATHTLLAALLPDTGAEDWRGDALCAQTDPDIFFPDRGGSIADARAICLACPVRAECLEFALTHRIREGIWGGLGDRDRRRLIARRGGGAS